MATLDIFNSDAFAAISMTRAVQRIPYQPAWLGSLNLFDVDRIRTEFAAIERRDGKLALIQSTERGGPPELGINEQPVLVPIRTPRLAKRQRQQAHSIQNVRAFGSESELMGVQDEVTRIQQRLRRDMELTHEFHRLGAVQGRLLDADGTSVLVNWYTVFGITEPSAVSFALGTPTTDVRGKCTQIVRTMVQASKGQITPASRIYGLCGNAFFDALVAHATVIDTYRYQEGRVLREGMAFASLDFGGITFVNYRGTDDGSTIAINTDMCRFFPANAPGIFGVAYAPFESADFVNTPGQDLYSIVVWDQERRFWWQPEIYSYPLHYCTMPELLLRASRT